jgi:O-antigen/teichoic acid export membrane protein
MQKSHYLSKAYITEKWRHAGFQKYFRNTGWIFGGKIFSLIISFIATAYIARNLGPTNYGQLSYAISYVGLFGFIASLGLDQIVYRDIIRFPEKKNKYLTTAFLIKSLAAIITICICTGVAFFLSSKDVSLFLIFIISLTFLFNPFQLLNYEFQAEAKSKYPTLVSLVAVLILNTLKIIVIFNNQGVIYLALIILLEPILMGAGLLYYRLKIYGGFKEIIFDKTIALNLLRDSFPLIFATAFFGIYARIDQVMIKNMLNTESVGLYDAAVRISELWYFLPNIIVASLFPAIINAKNVSQEIYYRRIKKLFIVVLVVSLTTAVITTFLSKYFILIIFGVGFMGAVSVLNIYVWSNIGATLNMLSQQILISENLSKKISIMIFLGMIINVSLNFWLIPVYGISGAAVATLISYIIPFVSLFLFKNTRRLMLNIIKI